MATEMAVRTNGAEVLERVLLTGDLEKLRPEERVAYYQRVCESLGLNPLTQPFDFLKLNGKLVFYAKKGAADQLRRRDGISIQPPTSQVINDTYVVTVTASDKSGRIDSDIGAVSIKGLGGEALANAMLKAVTKAKRRVTLSLCGLGMLDESEIESIPNAQPVTVDMTTGEIDPRLSPSPEVAGKNQSPATEDTWTRWHALVDAAHVAGLTVKVAPLHITEVALLRWAHALEQRIEETRVGGLPLADSDAEGRAEAAFADFNEIPF